MQANEQRRDALSIKMTLPEASAFERKLVFVLVFVSSDEVRGRFSFGKLAQVLKCLDRGSDLRVSDVHKDLTLALLKVVLAQYRP